MAIAADGIGGINQISNQQEGGILDKVPFQATNDGSHQSSCTYTVGISESDSDMCYQDRDDVLRLEDLVSHIPKNDGAIGNIIPKSMNADGIPASHEDFHSFLARAGGMDQDQLRLGLAVHTAPRPDEDFVAYLARTLGIKDKHTVNDWRQVLNSEGFPSSKSEAFHTFQLTQPKAKVDKLQQYPVKEGEGLFVREGEDAASFLLRTGSWVSSSSVSDDLACAGPEDDEDAESYLRRTDNLNADFSSFDQIGSLVEFNLPNTPSGLLINGQELECFNPEEQMEGQLKRKAEADPDVRSKRQQVVQSLVRGESHADSHWF